MPESKRYPETVEEFETVRSRGIAVANRLLSSSSLDLFVSVYGEDTMKTAIPDSKVLESFHFDQVGSVNVSEDEDPYFLVTFKTEISNSSDYFGEIIESVAKEELTNAVIFDSTSGNVFAPYDGGIDIFVADQTEKNAIRAEFDEWLSKGPDGL